MRKKGLDTRRSVIIAILFSVLLAVAFGTAGCGDQMARMQDNQIKLQAMVAANARQLATLSSQVHVHQSETAEGLAKLQEDVNSTDAKVVAVQNEQTELRRTVAENDRNLHMKVAQLADNQASLREGISHVADIAQRTNATVNTVARDQATLHQLVQNHNRELADSITAVANNQQQTHAGIRQLQQADQDIADRITAVASDVTTLGNEQAALHATVRGNTATLAEKIAAIQQNQSNLQSVIDRVADTADATADTITAMATTQATMRQTQTSQHESLMGRLGSVAQTQQELHADISGLHDKANAGNERLAALAAGQDAIQSTLKTNNDVVTAGLTGLANNHQDIHNHMSALRDSSDRVLADLATVAAEQTSLRQAVSHGNENLASIAEGQNALQHSLRDLDGKATALSLDVSTVSEKLSTLDESVRTGHEAAAGQATALADNQRMIQAGLNTMTATTNQGALTILTMANRQAEMEQTMQAGIAGLTTETRQLASGQQNLNQAIRDRTESLNTQLAHLSQEQQQLRGGLDTLNATTSQVALDVLAIHDTQDTQGQAMAANQQQLVARLDATAQGQQQIRDEIDTITATTTQVALDVLTVHESQARQTQAMQSNQQQLVARLDASTQGQQQIGESLDTIAATTTQTALDVLAVNDSQRRQIETAQANQQQLVGRLDATTQGQQRIGESLDTIAATTTQVALDVLAGNDSQSRQAKAIQAGQQTLASELATVAQGQQQVQSHLDTIAADTTQVAREVATVGDSQTRLEQAFEANRQELVVRLAQIAQGQQEWLTRFDAAQANIETMATSIVSLEQRVTKLQGTLQSSLADLSTLLDSRQERQAQFEDTVRQDVQTIGDSLSQLRQAQTGLEKQLQQMHRSSESQTEDLLTAIEQLRRRTETDAATTPAQIRSSKAQPEEILLP